MRALRFAGSNATSPVKRGTKSHYIVFSKARHGSNQFPDQRGELFRLRIRQVRIHDALQVPSQVFAQKPAHLRQARRTSPSHRDDLQMRRSMDEIPPYCHLAQSGEAGADCQFVGVSSQTVSSRNAPENVCYVAWVKVFRSPTTNVCEYSVQRCRKSMDPCDDPLPNRTSKNAMH